MAEITHVINGKLTSKEHFEQATKEQEPVELTPIQRLERLEHHVFPHLKPGAKTDEDPT